MARSIRPLLAAAALAALVALVASAAGVVPGEPGDRTLVRPPAAPPAFAVRDLDPVGQTAVAVDASGRAVRLARHAKSGPWALMAVFEEGGRPVAAFEDVGNPRGALAFLAADGVVALLPRSLERTSVPEGSLYGGHPAAEILGRDRGDVLGRELLAGPDDPPFERVARLLPPLRVPTFVGTRHSVDKPTFDYGAFSDEIYVDVGKVFPEIAAARSRRDVLEGLVGGWLPVPRWVFPVREGRAWDVTIFAEEDPAKFWTQPVWFRILLLEGGEVREAHHFYHHLPIPPRGEPEARDYYRALLRVRREWARTLDPPMKVRLPEPVIDDFCRHALAMEMITRIGNHPKYGYPPLGGINKFGGYGYSNVDTFQDVFNTSVLAFAEWGLLDVAKGYVDDYFTESVRDDGSIDTRGPETGQYGLMLAVVARYHDCSGDDGLILEHAGKLRAIVRMFDALWAESRTRPADDPAYGIIRGWSEHDSCLKESPWELVQPFFSNSALASRGFADLGRVFVEVGRRAGDAGLEAEGTRMRAAAEGMRKDLYASIGKTLRATPAPKLMPGTPMDVSRAFLHRVHVEMMHSGLMTPEMASAIARFGTEGGRDLVTRGGFLYPGFGYGVLHQDWVREYLLSYYSVLAHGYSPGTWTSVESAAKDMSTYAPYATCAQVSIPLQTKWMLAFDDPDAAVLWLAKATPRHWLDEGKTIAVSNAPTRFGPVGYELRSNVARGRIVGEVVLPAGEERPAVKLRVRAPGGRTIRGVRVNGRPWTAFDAAQEVIDLPPSLSGRVAVEVALTAPRR